MEHIIRKIFKDIRNNYGLQHAVPNGETANTINGKKLISNPILTGSDISNTKDGTYITSGDTLSNNIYKLDQLITTQIIE